MIVFDRSNFLMMLSSFPMLEYNFYHRGNYKAWEKICQELFLAPFTVSKIPKVARERGRAIKNFVKDGYPPYPGPEQMSRDFL